MAKQRGSRSPLVINISRLGRRPGSMMTVAETVPSPSRIGVELVAIEKDAPLDLDLRFESVSEGVLVTGTVSAPTVGECARCLTPITGHVEIDLTELFAYPDSTTEATTEADEVGHVVDDIGRPRTADRRRRRAGAAVLAAVRPGLPRAVPGLRHSDGDGRTGAPAREDRPALGEARLDAGDGRQVTSDRAALLKALGVELPDELLTMALTHRSYSYENGGLPTNERLEFLGDAVLGLTITDELYHRHPDRSEGDLAKLRASIVNTQALADVGRGLTDEGLGAYLLLGKGEEHSRWCGQVEHSGRRSRIPAWRNLSRARYRGGPRSDPAAVRRAHRHGADAGRGPGLEEQPAGADRRARYGCAVLRGDAPPDQTTTRSSPRRSS